jgi:hypothetical protein
MDKQMVAVCDKVKFSIPESTITIGQRGGDAWLFTTWGLIEWVFEHASPDGLLDFIHLWDSVDNSERINIIVDIAQARTQSD